MTSSRRRPGTRPPGRPDARRPSGPPPRTPGGGQTRTTTPDGRPPGRPHASAPRTRPADTRPPATPTAAPYARPAPQPSVLPAQTLRRPVVPEPRPTDVFADRLLAVLSGRRPVHWMLRYAVGPAYDELIRLAERPPLRTRGPLPVVRDIGWFVPRPGAIEAFARIGAGDRLRAMAFRLEQGHDLRWRCTAVELGGPRPPRGTDG